MIAVLVDEIFRVVVVLVVADAVVVVVQQSAFVRAAVFVPVRFRLEPEHFHFVGIHGAGGKFKERIPSTADRITFGGKTGVPGVLA